MKRPLFAAILIVVAAATGCEQGPRSARQELPLGEPVDVETMNACRQRLLGWASRDPGPDDLERRLAALRAVFSDCPKKDRMRALIEVALEGSPYSLMAGAVVAEGGRNSLALTLMTRVSTKSFRSPPAVPAWMLLWASDDVASVLSMAEGLFGSREALATQTGHALLMMLTHRNRAPDLLGDAVVAATTRIDRRVWQDVLDRPAPDVRSLVREAIEASFAARSGSLAGIRLSRTDENLEKLLTFEFGMRKALRFREAPETNLVRELCAELPPQPDFAGLRRAVPITMMIIPPEDLVVAGWPR